MRLMNKPLALGTALGLILLGALVVFKEQPDFALVQEKVDSNRLFPGTYAPPLRLESSQGEWIDLEDLKGGPAVLVFVTPTCPYCKTLKEEVLKLESSGWRNRLIFVSRNRSGDAALPDEAVALEKRLAGLCPVLQDTSGSVSELFKARAVPTAYMLNKNGRIKSSARGWPHSLGLVKELMEELGTRVQDIGA